MHEQPARRPTERERGRAQWVRHDRRGRETDDGSETAPALDASQVPEVVGAERGIDLGPEVVDVLGERLEVDGVDVERCGGHTAGHGARTVCNRRDG